MDEEMGFCKDCWQEFSGDICPLCGKRGNKIKGRYDKKPEYSLGTDTNKTYGNQQENVDTSDSVNNVAVNVVVGIISTLWLVVGIIIYAVSKKQNEHIAKAALWGIRINILVLAFGFAVLIAVYIIYKQAV